MPVQDVTPEEWRKLTQGDEGSIYIGPAKQPDDVLKKLMANRWPADLQDDEKID